MNFEEWTATIATLDSRAKSNSHRLDQLERRQSDLEELVSTVKVLAVRQEAVETDVKEIKADVKQLSSKSGRRWDAAVERVCWGFLTALVAFLLAKLGIG